jgi:phosphoglycolate phosphatase-like HAD superfamily hydrolase
MSRATVLLDIDGTLVDSNYHHSLAWSRALHRAGVTVPLAEIHRTIGMGADQLIERLAPASDGPLEEWWHAEFEPLLAEIRPTRGGSDLIRHLAASGSTNVYATSGSADDVGTLRDVIGADEWIAAAVNSSEVDVSKPAPDIFQLAIRRVDADPQRTIVVGDSVWDVRAATACGIGCVAVACGGIGTDELLAAGALAVYRDPQDLLEQLAASPLAALLT